MTIWVSQNAEKQKKKTLKAMIKSVPEIGIITTNIVTIMTSRLLIALSHLQYLYFITFVAYHGAKFKICRNQ